MNNKQTGYNWLNKNGFKKRDEYYTPKILVEPILKYINKDDVIWCPFDTENSEFVHILKENGNEVIYSHINYGQDFFEYEPKEHYDIIISNPPFTKKLEVFNRLFDIGKPFAMIMNLTVLNYQIIGNYFIDKNIQLLIVDKKVSFNGNTSSFNSSYFCYNLLPKDLIFTNIAHNNSKKNYTPSRMYQDFE